MWKMNFRMRCFAFLAFSCVLLFRCMCVAVLEFECGGKENDFCIWRLSVSHTWSSILKARGSEWVLEFEMTIALFVCLGRSSLLHCQRHYRPRHWLLKTNQQFKKSLNLSSRRKNYFTSHKHCSHRSESRWKNVFNIRQVQWYQVYKIRMFGNFVLVQYFRFGMFGSIGLDC